MINKTKEKAQIYQDYLNGMSLAKIAEKYNKAPSNMQARIDDLKRQFKNGIPNEWLQQFPKPVYELLQKNGITSESELYEFVESDKWFKAGNRFLGEGNIRELNSRITVPLAVGEKVKDHIGRYLYDYKCKLIYAKDARPTRRKQAIPIEWIETQDDRERWAELIQRWEERRR